MLDHGGHGGKPLSLRTVRYTHTLLHKILSDAQRAGLLEANAAKSARVPRIDPRGTHEPAELRVWNAEQLRCFLYRTRTHPLHPLWAVAAGTGMRRGELLGLRDRRRPRGGLVHVRRSLMDLPRGRRRLKTTKNARPRTLHLDEHTAAALTTERDRQSHRQAAAPVWENAWNLVFTSATGSCHTPDVVTRTFGKACVKAEVPVIRFHDLRHTHATLLLAAGVPAKVVSERLGHANVTITLQVYAHVLPAMDADAAERFADYVFGARGSD